jgi:hypothetical protein
MRLPQVRFTFRWLMIALTRGGTVLGSILTMRLPQVRFTIRRLMIAVAGVAIVLGWVLERRSRFLRLAEYHRSQITVGAHKELVMLAPSRKCVEMWVDNQGRQVSPQQLLNDGWHIELSSKYLDAAARPWLPVERDPPPPAQ